MMNRRLRVVQLTHNLALGGLEQVVITLCRTLDRDRFEPSVLCLWDKGEFAEQLLDEGISVEVIPGTRGHGDRTAFLKLAKVLRRRRVDILHTHNTTALLTGAPAGLLARTPTVVHTDHARDFPDKLRYAVAEHLASYVVFRVVGVSEHTTRNLHRYEWIPRRKLATIHNGIDSRRFRVAVDRLSKRRELDLPADAPVLALATRLVDQKDIPTLLEALAILADSIPDIILLIAGDGHRASELRQRAVELGVAERVRFLGLRRDLPALFAAVDVYVSTSVWEGLPMVLLEAMAAGLPIVATGVGGVPSAVADGVNGMLVPPRDASRFAEAVLGLLSDPERLGRYGSASREIFGARFSAEIMARHYESLYLRQPLQNGASRR